MLQSVLQTNKLMAQVRDSQYTQMSQMATEVGSLKNQVAGMQEQLQQVQVILDCFQQLKQPVVAKTENIRPFDFQIQDQEVQTQIKSGLEDLRMNKEPILENDWRDQEGTKNEQQLQEQLQQVETVNKETIEAQDMDIQEESQHSSSINVSSKEQEEFQPQIVKNITLKALQTPELDKCQSFKLKNIQSKVQNINPKKVQAKKSQDNKDSTDLEDEIVLSYSTLIQLQDQIDSKQQQKYALWTDSDNIEFIYHLQKFGKNSTQLFQAFPRQSRRQMYSHCQKYILRLKGLLSEIYEYPDTDCLSSDLVRLVSQYEQERVGLLAKQEFNKELMPTYIVNEGENLRYTFSVDGGDKLIHIQQAVIRELQRYRTVCNQRGSYTAEKRQNQDNQINHFASSRKFQDKKKMKNHFFWSREDSVKFIMYFHQLGNSWTEIGRKLNLDNLKVRTHAQKYLVRLQTLLTSIQMITQSEQIQPFPLRLIQNVHKYERERKDLILQPEYQQKSQFFPQYLLQEKEQQTGFSINLIKLQEIETALKYELTLDKPLNNCKTDSSKVEEVNDQIAQVQMQNIKKENKFAEDLQNYQKF